MVRTVMKDQGVHGFHVSTLGAAGLWDAWKNLKVRMESQ